MARVLVTGAGSLLARRTAEALLARGDTVVAMQRRTVGLDCEQVLGDIRDAGAVGRAARGCDAIVHAAARVGVVGSWEDFRSTNVDGTANVIAAARRSGASRVVHVSTPSVAHHGAALVGATAGAPHVDLRRASRAPYATSKAIAEEVALGAAADELAVVAVRPHLVWGPGDAQLVGRIIDRARVGRLALVGSGAALVDTTYIDGAAEALVAALDAVGPAAACNGRAYVVANGEPRPIRELLEAICAAAGLSVRPREVPRPLAALAGSTIERIWRATGASSEPPLNRFLVEQLGTAHWFDPRPARDDLGWQPSVTIDEGLARLRAWFEAGAPSP